MCYVLHLSTTSPEDLSLIEGPRIRFHAPSAHDASITAKLAHPRQWFVEANGGGCSCALRHLMPESASLGFGKPEAWMKEEEDHVAATAVLAAIIRRLVNEGYPVDSIDAWNGSAGDALSEQIVELSAVQDDELRFFENHHFHFR